MYSRVTLDLVPRDRLGRQRSKLEIELKSRVLATHITQIPEEYLQFHPAMVDAKSAYELTLQVRVLFSSACSPQRLPSHH